MPSVENLPYASSSPEMREIARKVLSFETAKGSVYSYDEEGKTTRYKTAAKERGEQPQQERQDITVFVHLTPDAIQKYLDVIHTHNEDNTKKRKVYVVEKLPDGTPRILRDIAQVSDPDNVYLAAMRNGVVIGSTKASLEPEIGANVFDSRRFQRDGKIYTERHLGNKVVEINYEE